VRVSLASGDRQMRGFKMEIENACICFCGCSFDACHTLPSYLHGGQLRVRALTSITLFFLNQRQSPHLAPTALVGQRVLCTAVNYRDVMGECSQRRVRDRLPQARWVCAPVVEPAFVRAHPDDIDQTDHATAALARQLVVDMRVQSSIQSVTSYTEEGPRGRQRSALVREGPVRQHTAQHGHGATVRLMMMMMRRVLQERLDGTRLHLSTWRH
jgi:hypothetical protein